MRIRSDGEETRRKILAAAAEVFGEKGYTKATFAEMGRRCELNPALISFHFRSKDELYRIVWNALHQLVRERWPPDGGLPDDAPAKERLQAHVRSSLNLLSDPDLGAVHRLEMQERVNASGLVESDEDERIQERRQHMRAVLQELLGDDATDEDIDLCEMSVANQLFVMRRRGGKHGKKGKHRKHAHGKHLPKFTRNDIDRLAEHITRFSLAGIAAVRETIAQR